MHQIWTSTEVPPIFHTYQFYIRAITIFSNSKQLSVVELDSPPPENIAIFFYPILFSLYVIFLLSILFYFSFEFLSLFPSHFFTHFTCLFGVHNGTHWMKLSNWPTRKCYIFKHFNFFGLLLVWRYVHIELQPSYWNGPYVCKVAWSTFFFFFFSRELCCYFTWRTTSLPGSLIYLQLRNETKWFSYFFIFF